MYEGLRDVLHNSRPADGVDIVLFALVLYVALRGLEGTIGRAGGLLLVGLAGLDFTARSFDLLLISWFLHGFFAVLVFGLMIVFHDDLRRLLRHLDWLLRHGWRRRDSGDSVEIDTVAQAAFALAVRRIGALFVLVGRESLDRLVEGGIPLGGRVSGPLLISLFDPHSPGHDGAVILDGAVVTRFSVHLPLSRDPRQLRDLGTRHRAALGLAERSDAMVVVVSEERGAVGVACQGTLEVVSSAVELHQRLVAFRGRPRGPRRRTWSVTPPLPGWRLQVLSLGMSCAAWFLFAFQVGSIERTVTVPIEYRNVPEQSAADVARYPEARVTLRGSPRAFRLLDLGEVSVSVDVSSLARGQSTYPLLPGDVHHPADLRVVDVQPHSLRFDRARRQPTDRREKAALVSGPSRSASRSGCKQHDGFALAVVR